MKSCMVTWAEEYLLNDNTYENHVRKFINFLINQQKEDQPANILSIDVDYCVGYYAKSGQINSVSSMENHLESIKAFYNFLIQKRYLTKNIIPHVGYAEFKKELINKYNLKEPKPRDAIQEDDIQLILDRLNQYFIGSNNYETLGVQGKEQYLHNLALRIYIKLSLIAPAKKNVLLGLKLSDFENNYRFVYINKVKIRIPYGLHQNLVDTLDFLKHEKNVVLGDDSKLFECLADIKETKNQTGNNLNVWFYYFLKQNRLLDVPDNKNSYPIEIINNTAIKHMITTGLNPAYISQITGVKIVSLEQKYYKNYEDKNSITYIVKMDNEINYCVAKSNYYNYI